MIKQRLVTLQRAEYPKQQHKKKEQTRTAFYRNPCKFVKSLFVKENSGILIVAARELEEHLRETYSEHSKIVKNSNLSWAQCCSIQAL